MKECKFTKQELIDDIYKFIDINNRAPRPHEMQVKNGFISLHNYYKVFGSWELALKEADVNVQKGYTKQELIDALYKFVNKNERVPTKRDMGGEYPSESVYYRTFGSWNNALIEAGLDVNVEYGIEYSEKEFIDSIHKFIKINNTQPRLNDMLACNGYIPAGRYIKYFGTWNNALLKAGIESDCLSRDELITELHRFKLENDRTPNAIEMRNYNGYPSYAAYVKEFGTWNNALEIAGLEINHINQSHTDDECCSICKSVITDHWRYGADKQLLCDKCSQSDRKYFKGLLDPKCSTGIGVLTEYVASTVLQDCIKCNTTDNFNSPYDLISKTYGTINVKSVKLISGRKNPGYWKFDKSRNRYTPDYYICLAFNAPRTIIKHVWIIPATSKLVRPSSITVSESNTKRAAQYEVDASPYNKVYQELDIYSLPEFRNLKPTDLTNTTSASPTDVT